MTRLDADAYLDRVGLASLRPAIAAGDPAAIERLARTHVAIVPFENLRIVQGEPIRLAPEEAARRIVAERAGGVCYELNGGLAWLLVQLGLPVRRWAARVRQERDGRRWWGIGRGHLVCEVGLPSGPMLVDVGFGGEAVTGAMPGAGRIVETPTARAYLLERPIAGDSSLQVASRWHATSPDARFTRSLVVSATRDDGIVTLAGTPGGSSRRFEFRLTERDLTGDRRTTRLDAEEARAVARERFGLGVDLPTGLRT